MERRRQQRRRHRVPATPEEQLVARLRTVAQGEAGAEASEERDAMVAMVVIRAIDRAKELTAVEGAGLALRRALAAAEKPLAGYLTRHLERQRRARRKKA